MNTNRAGYLPHSGVMAGELTSMVEQLPRGTFIDATYGYGSHFELLKKYTHLNLIGFDRDYEAVSSSSKENLVYKSNFSDIPNFLIEMNKNTYKWNFFMIFGLSSHQIDSQQRGFSFQQSSELDMRMDQKSEKTAKEVVKQLFL